MLSNNRNSNGKSPLQTPSRAPSRTPLQTLTPARLKYHGQALLKQYLNRRRSGEQEAIANRLGVLSGLIVAGISVGCYAIGAWNVLEQQSYNLLHHTRRELSEAPNWDDRLVVIALDDDSSEQIGQHPWSRDHYANLLQTLSVAQPATVAFDVLFSETTQQDPQFAQAVINSANVVLSVGSNNQGRYIDIADSVADPTQGFFLRGDNVILPDDDGISRRLWLQGSQGNPSFGVAALQVYTEVMASTTQAAQTTQTTQADQTTQAQASQSNQSHDGQATRAHSASPQIKTHFPSTFNQQLSPASSRVSEQAPAVPPAANPAIDPVIDPAKPDTRERSFFDIERFNIGRPSMSDQVGQSQPTMAELIPASDTVWINWPGEIADPRQHRPGDLEVYSYIDVINEQVDVSLFKNKIVLVGTTLAAQDPLRTPFHKAAPTSGIFFHAAAINNLLNQSYLRRLSPEKELLLLVGVAIGGSYFLRRLEASWRLVGVLGMPMAWVALAYGSFLAGWWLPVAAPIGTLFLCALAVQLHEQQEKQQLMALFSMNVSPGTAELIWRHKGEILDQGELAAQDLTATVLFMDIRGFTSITETLPSQKLLPWLNQYFETMTDCIMENGGMVDKYIGDAIMAVFGAPVPRTNPAEIKADAIAALKSAMEMHGRLTRLNHQLKEQNLPLIKFGIGVHTGHLVGGTVGNRHRLNYSLFGDTVNVAARIESMTKTLPESAPFSLLVSKDTYYYAQAAFPLERVRSTQLRGRKGQIDMYTLAQLPEAVPRPQAPVKDSAADTLATVTPIGLRPKGPKQKGPKQKGSGKKAFPHLDAS